MQKNISKFIATLAGIALTLSAAHGAIQQGFTATATVSSGLTVTGFGSASPLPTPIIFTLDQVNLSNYNHAEAAPSGPYELSAMTATPNTPVIMTVSSDDIHNGQFYLVNTQTGSTANNLTDSSLRIPVDVTYTPCQASGGAAPVPQIISAHTGDFTIPYNNASLPACLSMYSGTPGKINIERLAMPALPHAGTYAGTLTLTLSTA